MKPTIGRIVLYTTIAGKVWPAIVTEVEDFEESDETPDPEVVALTAFPPGQGNYPARGICRGDEGEPGSWHWPPRA